MPKSSCKLSKMQMRIWFQQGTNLCHQRHTWVKVQFVLCLLLLTILQLYYHPPPLPPPVSNSSCLLTQCQPLYASCYTVLLYFSRYCRFNSVQSLSRVWLFATPWTAARQASLSITLPEFTQTHVHWVSDAIQPSHPLSSPSPPTSNLSQHQGSFQISQLFTSGGQSIGVSASTSILPMNTQDWCPLGKIGWIALQSKELSKSSPTPQFKRINFWHSAFFTVQLSHPYMTTRKAIALTRWTFVGKVMSLLFNMLSR